MKTIGMIGGMSWESTATYYRIANEVTKRELGGLHSAKLILYSVDFQQIEDCQARGAWDESARILTDAARALERAGADFLVLCTNTMHKILPELQRGVGIPFLHIADATADRLLASGIARAALLGTKYTMLQDFYRRRLSERGIDVLIPDAEDVERINRTIYEELCVGDIRAESRAEFARVVRALAARGAEAVILGCTEIGLLISQDDVPVPAFDTAQIHAEAAAMAALEQMGGAFK